MSWLSIKLVVEAGSVDVLADALLEVGASSVDISPANTEGATADCSETPTLTALFPDQPEIAARIATALAAAGIDAQLDFAIERVADQDWVRSTQAQFGPLQVAPRLWVVPSWHAPPDPGATNLLIDPGLAFGTGAHPTTRLCLSWLATNLQSGQSVLDYGCGSGILAIAAMKLGAARAQGVDIDPAALLAARDNALQNRVQVDFTDAAGAPIGMHDIVLANILANPLKVLAPLLARATRPRGCIVLAGILEQQADEVAAAYGDWFDMQIAGREEDWVLISGSKR